MKRFSSLVFLLLVLAFLPKSSLSAQDSFDRHALLQSLVDNVVLPSYQNFVEASAALTTSIQDLTANPSLETLDAAQAAWRTASDTWEEISFLSINLELMALHNQVDKRPINEILMLRRIAVAESFEGDFVTTLGSNQKGLPAMEYFLFDPNLSNAELLAALSANPDALPFIAALAADLEITAQTLYAYWSPEGQDYAATFVAADQSGGDAQGSINILVNGFYSIFADILEMRLGEPAGLVDTHEVSPDLDDTARSGQALSRIEHNLIGVQRLFNGAEALGFDDYLDFLGAEFEGEALSTVINARFVTALESVSAIEAPLYQAILTEPEAVANAYNAIQSLYIPIRVDMSSHLSILVTFSDKDGDS